MIRRAELVLTYVEDDEDDGDFNTAWRRTRPGHRTETCLPSLNMNARYPVRDCLLGYFFLLLVHPL